MGVEGKELNYQISLTNNQTIIFLITCISQAQRFLSLINKQNQPTKCQ